MKSLFIGFIALSTTVMMFAQIPAINQPRRVLQNLAPVFQANVSSQYIFAPIFQANVFRVASVAGLQVPLTASVALNASVFSAFALGNSTALVTNVISSSTVVNATIGLLAVVATNTQLLYTAQLALVVAQAQQSVALAQAQIYDNLIAQAVLTLAAINQLSATSSTTVNAAALAAFIQLQRGFYFHYSFAQTQATNLTNYSAIAQSNLNLVANQGNTLFLAQFFAQYKIGITALASVNTVVINIFNNFQQLQYDSFWSSQTAANAAILQSDLQIIVDKVATYGVAADAAYTNATAAVTAAQIVVNNAFYFYTIAQSSIVAQQVISVTTANASVPLVAALNVTQQFNAANAAASVARTSLFNTDVQQSQGIANAVTQQNAYRIMMTKRRIEAITANENQLSAKSRATRAKTYIVVRIAIDKLNLTLAKALLTFYISN